MSEGGKISVNTDALHLAIGALSDAVDLVSGVSGNINDLITQYFGSWGTGNDPTAKQFGAVYVPASQKVENGATVTKGALNGAVDGVNKMVDGYRNTEDTNTAAASGS